MALSYRVSIARISQRDQEMIKRQKTRHPVITITVPTACLDHFLPRKALGPWDTPKCSPLLEGSHKARVSLHSIWEADGEG